MCIFFIDFNIYRNIILLKNFFLMLSHSVVDIYFSIKIYINKT